MKNAILIAIALPLLTALPVMAGSDDYTTQRSSQEQSYQNTIANQALQQYYKNNPEQSPNYTGASQKKASKKKGSLHQRTWGSEDSGETWGTKE